MLQPHHLGNDLGYFLKKCTEMLRFLNDVLTCMAHNSSHPFRFWQCYVATNCIQVIHEYYDADLRYHYIKSLNSVLY